MACRCTSTESRYARRAAAALLALATLLLALLPDGVRAHEPSRMRTREIVRLAGWFAPPPDGTAAVRTVKIRAQGKERTLHATAWEVYALVADQQEQVATAPDDVSLQGSRADLGAVAGARPEQRVSLLAERRPGTAELFLLSVELCPAR